MTFDRFMTACLLVERFAFIVKWSMDFNTKKACLSLLQDKGFKRYEELEYVDFEHAEKQAKIAVLKTGEYSYSATVQRFDIKSPINSRYSLAIFKRICEIILLEKGGI